MSLCKLLENIDSVADRMMKKVFTREIHDGFVEEWFITNDTFFILYRTFGLDNKTVICFGSNGLHILLSLPNIILNIYLLYKIQLMNNRQIFIKPRDRFTNFYVCYFSV
jgi:hypothetical protein